MNYEKKLNTNTGTIRVAIYARVSTDNDGQKEFCSNQVELAMKYVSNHPNIQITPVHYDSADGKYHIDTTIAEYDTRPFDDAEEFLNYRKTMKSEDCVKVVSDLRRVKVKSTVNTKGYIGKDLDRKILLSILMGYRTGLYQIPALDGLKQSEVVATVNSWGISKIIISDWKNCSRTKRQENLLPRELVEETLQKILRLSAV